MTLLERIKARREGRPYEPTPITEGPLSKRLRERREAKVLYNGAWQSPDADGAA